MNENCRREKRITPDQIKIEKFIEFLCNKKFVKNRVGKVHHPVNIR